VRLSALSEAHRTWAEKKIKRHDIPVATSFTFDLNVAATVRLTFTSRIHGREVHDTMAVAAKAGINRVKFGGKIGTRVLPAGHYTVTVEAAAGRTASTETLRFTIVV
jgi:hypothetical protein